MDALQKTTAPTLQAGQTKTIFYDPLTEQNPEGDAILVKQLLDRPVSEYWKVKFITDGFTANRFIRKPE